MGRYLGSRVSVDEEFFKAFELIFVFILETELEYSY